MFDFDKSWTIIVPWIPQIQSFLLSSEFLSCSCHFPCKCIVTPRVVVCVDCLPSSCRRFGRWWETQTTLIKIDPPDYPRICTDSLLFFSNFFKKWLLCFVLVVLRVCYLPFSSLCSSRSRSHFSAVLFIVRSKSLSYYWERVLELNWVMRSCFFRKLL